MSISTDLPLVSNLKRLLWLRGIVISCELMAVLWVNYGLHIELPLQAMLLIIALHMIINAVAWLRLRIADEISTAEFAIQLAIDTIILASLMYFAGGYTNPFVSLFLLPLVITAAVLPRIYTWLIALLTISCYSLLIFYYRPLAIVPLNMSVNNQQFGLHVMGMWFSFLLSAGLVVFFVVRMANTLRERDRDLAQAREKALHDEHLVAMGTLATGAAHELGTPLATMAVLANELKYDYADDPGLIEKAEIFRDQLNRCKAIISDISASTGQARGEGGGRVAINDYLEDVVRQWRLLRPQAVFSVDFDGTTPAPHILMDKTLTQAIINILNNAADASIDQVEVRGQWDSDQLTLDVCDRGNGLDDKQLATIGTPFYTTKPHGLGLGLYLARAVVERYSGSLVLTNRNDGPGIQARLQLPLTAISINDDKR